MRILLVAFLLAALTLSAVPASAWNVVKGPATTPTVNPETGRKKGFVLRDGRFNVFPSGDSRYPFMIIYPGYANYRLLGTSRFLEDMKVVSPVEPIFGGEKAADTWDNGGQWFLSVHRLESGRLVGFTHAEYHGYPNLFNQPQKGWFSTAVAYSDDNGASWRSGGQIITSEQPPPPRNKVEFGGIGNPGVVYDGANKRWLLYHSEYRLRVAMSTDPLGQQGSWRKYYNGAFSQPGLRGVSTPLKCLDRVPGTVPAVHWNTYLNKWVMLYHGYQNKSIFIAASDDGLNWDCPRLLVQNNGRGWRAWYPTLVGDVTDKVAGQRAHLYYLQMQELANGKHSRQYVKVPLTFQR